VANCKHGATRKPVKGKASPPVLKTPSNGNNFLFVPSPFRQPSFHHSDKGEQQTLQMLITRYRNNSQKREGEKEILKTFEELRVRQRRKHSARERELAPLEPGFT